MPPVPRIQRQVLIQAHEAEFRMAERALEIRVRHRPQQRGPAPVQRIQQIERILNRRRRRVRQLSPAILGVGLDHRLGFGEREPEPHIGVQVAVRQVMYNLAKGPAAGPVWRVQLGVLEASHSAAQCGRRGFQNRDEFIALGRRY